MASPSGRGNKPLAGRENHPASWTPVENRASMDETAAISSRSHLGTGEEAPTERTSTHRSAAGSQGQVELGRDGVFKVPLPPAPTVFSYHGRRHYPPRPTTANYPPPFPRAPFAPYFHDCLASREVGGRLVPIFVSAKWSAGLPLRQSVIDPAQPSITFPPVSLQRALAQLEQDTAPVRAALLLSVASMPPLLSLEQAAKAFTQCPPSTQAAGPMRQRAGRSGKRAVLPAAWKAGITSRLARRKSRSNGYRKGNDDVEAGPKAMEGQSHIHGQPQIAARLAPLTASLESTATSSRSHLGTGEEAPAERTSTHGSAAGSQGQVELSRDGVFKIPLPPVPTIVSHHGRRHYPPRPTTASYPPPFPRAPSAHHYIYNRMASREVVEAGPKAMEGQSQAHGQPQIATQLAPPTTSRESTAGGNVDAQAKSTAQHASSGAKAPSRATAPPPPLHAQQGTLLRQPSWPTQVQGASSKQPNTPASPQPMATAVDRPAAIDSLTGRLGSIKLGRFKWSAGPPLRQSVINPVQPSVTFPPVSLQRALAQLEQDTAPVRAALLLSVASMPPLVSLEQAAKAFMQCPASTRAAGPAPQRAARSGKKADVPAAWKAAMTSRLARRKGRSSQHRKGNDDDHVEEGPTPMEGQSQAHGQPQTAAQLAPLTAALESTAGGNVDAQAKSTAQHASSGAGAPSRATAPPPPLHAQGQQGTSLRQPSWQTQAQGASSNQPPTPASPQRTETAVDRPAAIDSLTGRLGSIKLGRFRPGHNGSTSAVRQPATEPSPASKPVWIFVPSALASLSNDAPTRSGTADDAMEHGTRGVDLRIVLPQLGLRDRWLVFLAHSDITALQSVDTAKHEPARLLAFLKWTRQPIVTPYASVHARDLNQHLSGLGDRDRMLIFVALYDPRHVHLIDEFRYPDAETGKWVTLAWHAYFVDYNVPVADQKVWVQSLSRCYPVYYTPTTMAGLTGPIEHIEHICTTPPYADMPQEELRWTLYKQYACSPILPWALSTLPGEHVDKQLKCGRGIRGLFDRMPVDMFSKGAALDAAHQSSCVVTKPPSLPRQKRVDQRDEGGVLLRPLNPYLSLLRQQQQGGQSAASTTKQSADVGPEWTVYVDSLGQSVRIKTLRTAQLREVLGKRGLNTRGNKADLRQRLQSALDEDATMQLENRVRQPDANVIMPASLTTTVNTPPIKLAQPPPAPAPAPASLSATPVQALVPKAPAVSTGKGAAATTGASVPAVGPSTFTGNTSGEGLQPKTVSMRTHKNDEAQSRVKPEEEHQAIRAAERSKLIRFLGQHATEIGTDERAGTAHTLLRVFKNHQVMWNLLLKDYGVPAEQHKDWLE